MKSLLIGLIVLMTAFRGFAQDAENPPAPLKFEWIIPIDDSSTKTQLFARAKAWLAESYRSSNAVVQDADTQNGMIIGRAIFPVAFDGLSMMHYNGEVSYNVRVDVKDRKCRLTLYNFVHRTTTTQGPAESLGIITSTDEYVGPVLHRMTRGMLNRVHAIIKESANSEASIVQSSFESRMKTPIDSGW